VKGTASLLEIPVYDQRGVPTGTAAKVPNPPPLVWRGLRLQTVRELQRFGCGCFWQERRVYAPRGAGVGRTAKSG
jgi:hypothetical protein